MTSKTSLVATSESETEATDKSKSTAESSEDDTDIDIFTIRRATLNKTPIRSRTVPLNWQNQTKTNQTVTVWEMEQPSELIEYWMSSDTDSSDKSTIGDPFGVVMWPGSILAAQEMERVGVTNTTVLILGAGPGVEAQAAAKLGARRVIATDTNPFTLKLLDYGAREAGLAHIIETRVFDICDERQRLPLLADDIDVVVMADVLYNAHLAKYVGMRCYEVLTSTRNTSTSNTTPKPITLIVTDSQRFHGTNFVKTLNKNLLEEQHNIEPVEWQEAILTNVTGSGIMIKADQTYDVKARMLSVTTTTPRSS
jgi:SAM-dependent methyltransferase